MLLRYIFTAFFAATGLLNSASAKADDCAQLSQLAWILGDWEAKSEKYRSRETWRAVSEQSFEGGGQTIDAAGKTLGSESLRLVQMEGDIFYLARPRANPLPVAFKLVHCEAQGARFENPNHDFPKSLYYRLQDRETLMVSVRGENDQGFDLQFTRFATP